MVLCSKPSLRGATEPASGKQHTPATHGRAGSCGYVRADESSPRARPDAAVECKSITPGHPARIVVILRLCMSRLRLRQLV